MTYSEAYVRVVKFSLQGILDLASRNFVVKDVSGTAISCRLQVFTIQHAIVLRISIANQFVGRRGCTQAHN